MNTHQMPGMVLGLRDTKVNKLKHSPILNTVPDTSEVWGKSPSLGIRMPEAESQLSNSLERVLEYLE